MAVTIELDSIEEVDLLIYGIVAFINAEQKRRMSEWKKLQKAGPPSQFETDSFWRSYNFYQGGLTRLKGRIEAQRQAIARTKQ
jgi:hypothetical protein